ncbi:MAG TPA: septum formation initiator family protein [Candidatus Paceibacterota bacterium]
MITRNIKFGKRRKRLFESVVVSGVFAVVFVLIVGLFIFQNVKMNSKRSDLEKRAQELQAQVQELSLQREALQANAEKTQTQEYQEKVLREQGLYKKEGEQVVTVLPPEAPAETEPMPEKKDRIWWNPFTW